MFSRLIGQSKNREVATLLAWIGVILPISGLHKFYLGQPGWGILYLLLSWTPIPKIASIVEGIWYLSQNQAVFDSNFNSANQFNPSGHANPAPLDLPIAPPLPPPVDPAQVGAIAAALRHLDQLRQDGLISEYEFEQKRRQLLDRIA
jgi:TM2 domain-containing membrane protein YozV